MKKAYKIIKPIFSFPLLLFRSVKRDSFVSGLIFGAIFSLFVNIITIQTQEIVQKQRVFEALEHEIVDNAILANTVMETNLDKLEEKELPNYYHVPNKYSREVWGTSEALKYIVQLDPEVQTKLSTYYKYTIDGHNELLDKDIELSRQKLPNCYFYETLNEEELRECVDYYHFFLKNEIVTAEAVGKESFGILKIFHPTQDRLNSFLLRLIMGSKAVRILSGE